MNSELNRTEASKQYFELRNGLNHANRIKNLKTELEFELRKNEEEHFIIIKSTAAEHGLRLAFRRNDQKYWVLFQNDTYSDFYKYMYHKIIKIEFSDAHKINTILTDWLIRLWVT